MSYTSRRSAGKERSADQRFRNLPERCRVKEQNKGVFITTSAFTREAMEYAQIISSKIILVDGQQLAGLMVDHNIGVSTVGIYELKRLDNDYFEGE